MKKNYGTIELNDYELKNIDGGSEVSEKVFECIGAAAKVVWKGLQANAKTCSETKIPPHL